MAAKKTERKRKPNTWVDRPPDYEKHIPGEAFGNMMGREEADALMTVMNERVYTWGRFVDGFETEFADFVGVKYAYAVSGCTAALEIASKLIGLKEGDEVVTTPVTFHATSLAPLGQGAKIVFADIDPVTHNIDPESIAENITGRTKAVVVVHLDGIPCDMDPIMELAREHKLTVVEDCAHAPGGEYKGRMLGSIGDFGCFSFHARKNMSTLGEGGMITTNSDQFGEEIPTMRCIGHKKLATPRVNGLGETMNHDVVDIRGKIPSHYRMNDFQAAAGSVQLKKLPMMNKLREDVADYYHAELCGIEGITPPQYPHYGKSTYHRYTAVYDEDKAGMPIDDFLQAVANNGGHFGHTYLPSYLFGIYESRGYRAGLCPRAEDFYRRSVMLPIYPELTPEMRQRVIDMVKTSLTAN